MTNNRFIFIDSLRGIAALSVAFMHIGYGYIDLSWWTHLRHGVTIFFVLSGFVICHSLMHKQINLTLFGRFTLRRALRLDPAYWVAIVLAIVILWLPAQILDYSVQMPSLTDITLHMFYLQDLAQVKPISTVFWTLCYEFQFYLVFCALLGLAQKGLKNRVVVFLFCVLLLASCAWPIGLLQQITPGLFINLWFLFLLGAVARWAKDEPAALITVLCCCVLLLLFTETKDQKIPTSIVGVATALALLVAHRLDAMNRWLNWRWLQYFGLISYSLYLVHDMLGQYIRSTGLHLSNKYLQLASPSIDLVWCAIALISSILAAHALYALVEKPSHKLSRKIKL